MQRSASHETMQRCTFSEKLFLTPLRAFFSLLLLRLLFSIRLANNNVSHSFSTISRLVRLSFHSVLIYLSTFSYIVERQLNVKIYRILSFKKLFQFSLLVFFFSVFRSSCFVLHSNGDRDFSLVFGKRKKFFLSTMKIHSVCHSPREQNPRNKNGITLYLVPTTNYC